METLEGARKWYLPLISNHFLPVVGTNARMRVNKRAFVFVVERISYSSMHQHAVVFLKDPRDPTAHQDFDQDDAVWTCMVDVPLEAD